MSDSLQSSKATLARAKHHCHDFNWQFGIYFDSKPFSEVLSEFDPNTNQDVYKVKLAKPMPAMLNGIAADAINNLRSALDQAGFAASIAAGGNGKNTYFPFGDTAAEVNSRKATGSKEIPGEIFSLMESFKPYRGGDDLLWALNKLCNTHKHRILMPIAMTTGGARLGEIGWDNAKGGKINLVPIWDSAKNEMEIARMPHGAHLKYKMQLAHSISFGEIDAVKGLPAASVLRALILKVDGILMAIEAEARRIGLIH